MRQVMAAALLVFFSIEASAQTLEQILTDLQSSAFPPGKKDSEQEMDYFRVGLGLFDLGEGQGGYLNYVSEMSRNPPTDMEYGTAETVPELLGCTQNCPEFLLPGELGTTVHDVVFQNTHAVFDVLPAGDDFAASFEAYPQLDMMTAQMPVFAPVFDFTNDDYTFFDYPVWRQNIAPRAAAHGLRLTQNIGFSSNPTFPSNAFQFNQSFPLRARPIPGGLSEVFDLVIAQSAGISATRVLVDPDVIQARVPQLGMIHPDVAGLVKESIVDSVMAFPEGSAVDLALDYTIINGEFDISSESNAFVLGFNETCREDLGLPINTYDEYLRCLPLTDYSEPSLVHFVAWIQERYETVEQLKLDWGVSTSWTEFSEVTPLHEEDAANHDRVLQVWEDFQHDQEVIEAHQFQYAAAKATRPDQAFLRHDEVRLSQGGEYACYYSDGAALGDWYAGFYSEQSPEFTLNATQVKRDAMLVQTYGEPFIFPLFAFARTNGPSCTPGTPCLPLATCCWEGTPPDPVEIPVTYEPPCVNQPFAYRTIREMTTLGLNALGIAYWEAPALLSLKSAKFCAESGNETFLPAEMADEVGQWRNDRVLMTPWLSPVLMHLGRNTPPPGENPAHPWQAALPYRVLDVLATNQAHVAPFTLNEALDDLWVTGTREGLVSAFVDDLGPELLDHYCVTAQTRQWSTILILARRDTLVANFGADWRSELANQACLELTDGGDPLDPCAPERFDNLADGECTPGVTIDLWVYGPEGVAPDSDGSIVQCLRDDLAPFLESRFARAVRPITLAAEAGTSPQDLLSLDLNVMTDGLNFLVSLANLSSSTAISASLTVNEAAPLGVTYPSLSVTLQPLESRMLYMGASISDLTAAHEAQLPQAVQMARGRVNSLTAANYQTDAAHALLDRLDELLADVNYDRPERLIAGLVRLRRMIFVNAESSVPGGRRVRVRDWQGAPVDGVQTQRQFLLQNAARTDGPDILNGGATIDLTRPDSPQVWDFTIPGYITPEIADSLCEINLLHPTRYSHASVVEKGQ